jgi:putative endonuclease
MLIQDTWLAIIVIPALSRNPYVMKTFYVYILASKKKWPLYIGITNDLIEVHEHKSGLIEEFTKKYSINSSFILNTLKM